MRDDAGSDAGRLSVRAQHNNLAALAAQPFRLRLSLLCVVVRPSVSSSTSSLPRRRRRRRGLLRFDMIVMMLLASDTEHRGPVALMVCVIPRCRFVIVASRAVIVIGFARVEQRPAE